MPQGDLTEVGEKGEDALSSQQCCVIDPSAFRRNHCEWDLFSKVVCTSVDELSQLSGGQRARVSLARAVYARADLCVKKLYLPLIG